MNRFLAEALATLSGSRSPQGEASRGVRGLVLLGMLVALAATGWVTGDSSRALLLMAAVVSGHLLSWRRRDRNAGPTYLLMLLALLAAFFSLRGELLGLFAGGSLLHLARFLAMALAAISFGLHTRRNLHDAHALSLAVLLLAGEQALTLGYLWLLLAFGLVSMALLTAGHVSAGEGSIQRVGFPRLPTTVASSVAGVVAVLVATAVVYVLLPQNHTVSAAGPLPSRLDLTSGWPPPPSGGFGGDWAPWADFLPSRDDVGLSLGPGEFAGGDLAQYLDLEYVGDRERDVVMYVRSPLASFWRGSTMDVYDGHGWVASSASVSLLVDYRGRLRFADAPSGLPGRSVCPQSYFLRVAQPNALFTGYGPGWIGLGTDDASTFVRDPGGYLSYLREATTYRVISPTPRLTPGLLRGDRADTSDEAYLALPQMPDRVGDLARRIVAGAATDYDKAARLERFLLTQYPYDLRVSPYPRDGDAVDHFLFQVQAGYCSQFATAMAVMGRLVGLPTRVAIGYIPGEYQSLTGVHAVRLQDAHAWVEVRFEESGWVAFDPTPQPNSPWAMGFGSGNLALGGPAPAPKLPGRGPGGRSGGARARLENPFGGPVALPLAALGMTLLAALAVLGALRFRRTGGSAAVPPQLYTSLAGADREEVRRAYREALRLLSRRGLSPKLPHQGVEEYLATLSAGAQRPEEAFTELTALSSRASYDPRPFPQALGVHARTLLQGLKASAGAPRDAREG